MGSDIATGVRARAPAPALLGCRHIVAAATGCCGRVRPSVEWDATAPATTPDDVAEDPVAGDMRSAVARLPEGRPLPVEGAAWEAAREMRGGTGADAADTTGAALVVAAAPSSSSPEEATSL